MGQKPRVLNPEISLHHFFGAELRRLRTLAGMSQVDLGQKVFVSGDLIGKIEKGMRRPSPDLARLCDEVLSTGGMLSRLVGALHQERALETAKTGQGTAGGPPQTSPIGTLSSPSLVFDDVSRIAGAAWFGMVPDTLVGLPAAGWAPSQLPSKIEWPHVHALRESMNVFEQWDHQYGGGVARAAMGGQMEWACRVARTASMAAPVQRAWQSAAARLGDLVGWAYFDAGQANPARRYFLAGLQLAGEAGDVQQRTHTATSLSRQMTYIGQTDDAMAVADLARLGWRSLPPLGRAVIGIVEARAYARVGDAEGCLRAVDACDQAFAINDPNDIDDTWGYYADEGQILGDAGHALFDLAMHNDDAQQARGTVARLRAAYVTHPCEAGRSKALTMIRVACLEARHGDPAVACSAAEQAVADAGQVWSRRVHDDLCQLDQVLAGIPDPELRDRTTQIRQNVRRLTTSG